MDIEERSYTDVLDELKHPPVSKRRDPRIIRLAAVTSALLDVLDEDTVTASKVYAKAVTALEGTLTSEQQHEPNDCIATQMALIEILNVTIPYMTPNTIINATLPLTSRVIRGVVKLAQKQQQHVIETKDELGGINALLRSVCRVTTTLVQHFDSTHKLDEQAVNQLLMGTLLHLFHDKRPKVRKTAQNSVVEILVHDTCQPVVVKLITKYVQNELTKAIKKTKENNQDGYNDLLHLLSFMEKSILYLNSNKLGTDLMEFLTILMQQYTNPTAALDFVILTKVKENTPKIIVIHSILAVVFAMLQDDNIKRKSTLDEFAPRVLASLVQAKPSLVFSSGSAEYEILQRTRIVYGQLVLTCCNRIIDSNNNVKLAVKLLPVAVQVLLILSRPTDEDPEDASVSDTLMVELTQTFRNSKLRSESVITHELLDSMEKVLEPIYWPTWTLSLKCLAVLLQISYDVLSSSEEEIITNIVENLIELRNESVKSSSSQRAVEDALSVLIQGVGIEQFWKWITWNTPKSKSSQGIDMERAWILTTMKKAALTAQGGSPRLAFFQTEVLGLARKCDKLAATCRPSEKNFYRRRVIELWALFPCFCRSPTDIEATLPTLSTTLCRAMEDKRYPELMDIIPGGLTVLIEDLEANGALELETTSGDTKAVSEASNKILPILFKFVTDVHATVSDSNKQKTEETMDVENVDSTKGDDKSLDSYQKLQSVTNAIAALARVASRDFLVGLFKKIMHRLLEEMQSDSADSERICAFLTLSQALITSQVLDESSVSFLYRALKPIIRNDEHGPRVQKRAYKLLAEICEKYHSFICEPARLKELAALLSGTIMTSQIAARHMRLKCLNLIVDGLNETHSEQLKEMHNIVAEILLCIKDANGKTRDAAYQMLSSLASRGDMMEFTNTLIAALGAETSHMRSAAVLALSRVVFENARTNESLQSILPNLLKTVLVLTDEGSREVIKSVVGFVRICTSAIPKEQLEPLLPELLSSLLKSTQAKSRFRAKIKIILKKLVRLYGYEALMPHVPVSETRLLTHMRKLDEREKRRKEEQRESGEQGGDHFDEMVDSDEEDSDEGRTFYTGATGLTQRTRLGNASKAISESSRKTKKTLNDVKSTKNLSKVRLPDETDGEVVDMLGPKISKRVHFAEEMDGSDSEDSAALEFDDEGRLIVPDEESANASASKEPESKLEMPAKRRKVSGTGQSQGRSNEKTKGDKESRALGASYKSKRAGGDVKKKGQKYEPYAYVPLDGRSYSKKNRRSAVEQMSTVVRKGGKRKR